MNEAHVLFLLGVFLPFAWIQYNEVPTPTWESWSLCLGFVLKKISTCLWSYQLPLVIVAHLLVPVRRLVWYAIAAFSFCSRLHFLYKYFVACPECHWYTDVETNPITKLWFFDSKFILHGMLVFIIVESLRFRLPLRHTIMRVVATILIGYEVVTPLFLLTLEDAERNMPAAQKLDVGNWKYLYYTLAVVGISEWFEDVFVFANTYGADRLFDQITGAFVNTATWMSMSSVILQYGVVDLYFVPDTNCLPTAPGKRAQFKSSIIQWLMKLKTMVACVSNVAGCIALFCFFREYQPNHSFRDNGYSKGYEPAYAPQYGTRWLLRDANVPAPTPAQANIAYIVFCAWFSLLFATTWMHVVVWLHDGHKIDATFTAFQAIVMFSSSVVLMVSGPAVTAQQLHLNIGRWIVADPGRFLFAVAGSALPLWFFWSVQPDSWLYPVFNDLATTIVTQWWDAYNTVRMGCWALVFLGLHELIQGDGNPLIMPVGCNLIAAACATFLVPYMSL